MGLFLMQEMGLFLPPKMLHICPTMYTGTDVYVLHSERQIIYYLMGTTIYSDKNFVVPPHLLFCCTGECGGGTDQCGWWEKYIIFGLWSELNESVTPDWEGCSKQSHLPEQRVNMGSTRFCCYFQPRAVFCNYLRKVWGKVRQHILNTVGFGCHRFDMNEAIPRRITSLFDSFFPFISSNKIACILLEVTFPENSFLKASVNDTGLPTNGPKPKLS